MDIKLLAEGVQEEVIAIRRHLHEHPELSEQEVETGKYICACLDAWGIPYETGVANTGVVATIAGAYPGKTVGLRADIDALPLTEATGLPFASKTPGVMHACGHDGHTAVALGAAKLLNAQKELLHGNVKIFFQPAEETVGGAKRMIAEGCLENPHVDYVLGLHMAPNLSCGTVEFKYGKMMAASDEFTVILSGKSCHGAHPELGVDAIAMAGQVLNALQTVVSRSIAPVNSAVVTVGKIQGGSAGNVIADRVELTGIIRCLDPQTRVFLHDRIHQIVTHTATAFGGVGELILRPSYSPLINTDSVVETMETLAVELLGREQVQRMAYPDMGTEDFSFFALERPSCFWHLGCGNAEKGMVCDVHNPKFDLDEDCLAIGVALQVAGVHKLLET